MTSLFSVPSKTTIAWIAAVVLAGCSEPAEPRNTTPNPAQWSQEKLAQLQASCSRCHQNPPPDVLPVAAWREAIEKMYRFVGVEGQTLDGFTAEEVIAWYQQHAPLHLPALNQSFRPTEQRLGFRLRPLSPPNAPPTPAVSFVKFVDRNKGPGKDLLFCDMRHHMVTRIELMARPMRFDRLGQVPHPAKVALADFTGDGVLDYLVANLGSRNPSDHADGTVELIDGTQTGSINTVTLLDGVGRVCDVRAADLDQDQDLDLAVGVFGWHTTGQVLWLKNRGLLNGRYDLLEEQILERTGVIGMPLLDLDGDQDLDIVALFSQEHEVTMTFLNQAGRFQEGGTVDIAPHPAWGSNWIELVDFDLDGDQDILLTNGDTLDDLYPKPYHGIRWLENQNGQFRSHRVGFLYAAHSAKAADLDGDGDLDVVASAFIPQADTGNERNEPTYDIPSLAWFEQTEPGEFKAWVIKRRNCFHATLDLADADGDGDIDIALGSFTMTTLEQDHLPHWIEIYENRGPPKH